MIISGLFILVNILLINKNLNNEKEYNLKLSNFINYYNIIYQNIKTI